MLHDHGGAYDLVDYQRGGVADLEALSSGFRFDAHPKIEPDLPLATYFDNQASHCPEDAFLLSEQRVVCTCEIAHD